MFGRECRTELDIFFGANKEPSAGGNWVALHQRRLQNAYELARRQTEHVADARKHLHDRNVDTAILSIGDFVYTRNRGLMGRNKIQDQWRSKVYKVSRALGRNVYMVEPADGLGHTRTLNCVELCRCRTSPPVVQEDFPRPTNDAPTMTAT